MSSTALQKILRASASAKTALLTPGAEVAATTRDAPAKSPGANSLGSHSALLKRTQSAICGRICGAMTRTRALDKSSPSILPSATAPPPTTTTSLPSCFTNMGKRVLVSGLNGVRNAARWQIAFDGGGCVTRQDGADFVVRTAGEELAKILSVVAANIERAEQALDGVRHFRSGAAIANRPRDGSKLAEATADTKVVGVDHLAIDLDLLPFDPDVRDPVLAAAIGAAGDVEFELLLKRRQTIFQLFGEPAREALGFS